MNRPNIYALVGIVALTALIIAGKLDPEVGVAYLIGLLQPQPTTPEVDA